MSSATTAPGLPRLLLLGDSIRLGYAPRVAALLAGTAAVVSPAANGGDSANVLRHLGDWPRETSAWPRRWPTACAAS